MAVTLYKYGPACGLPDLSPFCIKLETFLRMAQIPYETSLGYPSQAPKGKLPYIEYNGNIVSDSSLIVDFLTDTFDVPLDSTLDNRQTAVGRAFQSMIEEHLYFAIVYFRWQDEEGWSSYESVVTQTIHQAGAPMWLSSTLSKMSRKSVLKSLLAQGTGRHSRAEVSDLACQQLSAMSNFLTTKSFFLGEKPSSIDATVYSFLASILFPPFENPLREHALELTYLVDYCERMRNRYWNDLLFVEKLWPTQSPISEQ